MVVEGWRLPVVVDLAGLDITAQRRPVRMNHDPLTGVGHTERLAVVDGSLVAEGQISRATGAAADVISSAKQGFPWQMSIGARILDAEDVRAGKSVVVNGRQHVGPLTVARKAVLGEVSFVDLGADDNTSATITAKMATQNGETMNNDNVNGGGVAVADDVQTERDRVSGLTTMLAAKHPDLLGRAVSEGWDTARAEKERDAAELAQLRASRPQNVHPIKLPRRACPGGVKPSQLIAAAVLLHGGYSAAAEKHLGAEAANVAEGLRCRTLLDIVEASLHLAHRDVPGGRNEMLHAGFSNVDLTVGLGLAAEKIALDAYLQAPATWRSWCSRVNLNNFKQAQMLRATFAGGFEPLAPNGELKHGTVTEETYPIQAGTTGRLLIVDRTAIVNDDLGILTGTASGLGRMGARAVSDAIYTLLLSNPSFFSEANGNLLDGASYALGINAISEAITLMRVQVDSDGRIIDLVPSVLAVPPELEAAARVALNSTLLARDTSSADALGQGNPLPKLTLEVEPRLSAASYAGNSATGWYLFTPGAVAVGFLNGVESPIIEQVDPGAAVLGVGYRGYLDFGVAAADHRCGVFATGASS